MIKLNDLSIGYFGEPIMEHLNLDFEDGLIYGVQKVRRWKNDASENHRWFDSSC